MWNRSDTPPFLIGNLEHLFQNLLGRQIAGMAHRANVLVFDPRFATLQLLYEHENGFQQVHWLESTNHNGNGEITHQPLILLITHNGANMPRRDESLHAVLA